MKKLNAFFFRDFLFVTSCRQPENVNSANSSISPNEIRQDHALLISNNFDALFAASNNRASNNNARTGDKEKNVKRIKTFSDTQRNALYHVITYYEGGFVIVSAEKRSPTSFSVFRYKMIFLLIRTFPRE